MAFSVVASSSLLSSRVSTPLKKQNKRNSRNSQNAFSCKAMSDAEIDAKYPVGGSVYKVKSF